MRFLTHTRLTWANEMCQGRNTISFTLRACVEAARVPGSVPERWSGWMTRTHPDEPWQRRVMKTPKQRSHVSVSLFRCGHSQVLRLVLLLYSLDLFCLLVGFKILGFSFEFFHWGLAYLHKAHETSVPKMIIFYVIQSKTQNLPALYRWSLLDF